MNTFVAILLVTLTHINHAISLGFVFTNGIYQVIFLETFSRGSTLTSWVSSVQLGMLCLTGPLGSLLIGYLGCGITMFIGAVVASFGIGISAFMTNVEQLIVTFGFLSGAGFSLIFTASLCVIPEKFTTYRIVASGISLAGSGIGTVLWSWVSRYLLEEYGWRSALLISSGLSLQICVTGMVISLHDAKASSRKEKQVPETKIFENNNKLYDGNVKPHSFDFENIEMKHYHLPPKHRSLMNLKLDGSYQCLSEKRTASCYIETTASYQSDIRSKRMQIADSFLGNSLSSVHELYRSAILYHEAEEDKNEKEINKIGTITKEVFTDINFVLLSVNTFLFCFGLSVVYTHIAAYAASVGLSTNDINAVLSALGISNLLGRILLGVIGNQCKCLNIVFLYSGCYLLSGLGTLCMTWWVQPVGLVACATVVGYFTGAFAGVLTELTCLLLGAHRFYLAYGYLLVFMGIGFAIGAPIAGGAYDYCHYYPASLYIGSAAFALSAIVILPSFNSLGTK